MTTVNSECLKAFTSSVNLEEPETDFTCHASTVIESYLTSPEGCEETSAHKIFELLSEAEHSGKLNPEFINLFTGEGKNLLTWLVPYLIFNGGSPAHMKKLLGSPELANQSWTAPEAPHVDWYSVFSSLVKSI